MTHAFASLLDEWPDEPWFVEPRDRSDFSEEKRQMLFLRDLRMCGPSVIAWAVPNAAKRTRWAAAKAKREGMVAGALDLTLVWKGGQAFVEFKNGRDMPTPSQRDMLNRLYRAGHHCGVFRTGECLLEWLRSLGAPVRLRG